MTADAAIRARAALKGARADVIFLTPRKISRISYPTLPTAHQNCIRLERLRILKQRKLNSGDLTKRLKSIIVNKNFISFPRGVPVNVFRNALSRGNTFSSSRGITL